MPADETRREERFAEHSARRANGRTFVPCQGALDCFETKSPAGPDGHRWAGLDLVGVFSRKRADRTKTTAWWR